MARVDDYTKTTAPQVTDGDPQDFGNWTEDEFDKVADGINALIDNVETLKSDILESFTAAGYGGMGMNAPTTIGTVTDTAWVKITGFDLPLVIPKAMTYDFPNDGLIFDSVGIWQISFKITLTFAEAQAGRRMEVRIYNETAGIASGVVFHYFIGRNTAGANFPLTVNLSVDEAEVGDRLVLQLKGHDTNDDYTDVQNIGTIFQANTVSEFKGEL